jgi:opacity protein-like surface antigen
MEAQRGRRLYSERPAVRSDYEPVWPWRRLAFHRARSFRHDNSADLRLNNAFICAISGPPSSTEPTTANTAQTVRAGGTVGVGVEWMIAPRVSLKAEYLFADLGTTRSTILYTYIGGTSSMTSSVHNRFNIGRAGLNWHF